MKKSTILFAALFLVLPFVYGSDPLKKMEKSFVEEKQLAIAAPEAVAVPSLLSLMEENQLLKRQNEALTGQMENLSSRLEYIQMMTATLDQLHNLVVEEKIAETRSQVDFAKMMYTTLLNLNQVAGK